MAGALTLTVDRTWNGAPVAPDKRAALRLAATAGGEALLLTVGAPFHGDPPPSGPPGPTPGLWEHEVVELFVAGPGGADEVEYLEIELSPHGHHLALRLRGVRRPFAQALPLAFRATIAGTRWHGEATIPRAWLPPPPHRAAAFAIHGPAAARRHLASLALPGPRADFHQPDCFPAVALP